MKYPEAHALLEESQAISIEAGADGEQTLAETLNWMGMTTLFGDNDCIAAKSLLNHGLEIYRKLGDVYGVALSIFHLGIVESDQGHQEAALSHLEQSLAMFRQLGDLFFIARVSLFLGREFLRTGNYEKARFYLEEHLRIDQELQFWDGIADGWRDLGILARAQGELDQAEAYYEKSLMVSNSHGLHTSDTLYHSGLLALQRKDYSLARRRFSDLLELKRKAEDKAGVGLFLIGLAVSAGGINQPEGAVRLSAAARVFLEACGETYPPGEFKEFMPLIQAAREQVGEAMFNTLQAEGRAMTIERAGAYVREEMSGNAWITYNSK